MPPSSLPRTAASRPRRRQPVPPGVPEKFWDREAGAIRTDALLKSYVELERKLGSMVPLPGDDDQEGRERLWRVLGVPDAAEDYQIEARDELLQPTAEINAKLHRAGFTQAQAQLVYDLAAEHVLPLIDDVAGELQATRDGERLAKRFGGDASWQNMARQIRTWGQANLAEDVYRTLAASYDGVLAMHQMMQAREPSVLQETNGDSKRRRRGGAHSHDARSSLLARAGCGVCRPGYRRLPAPLSPAEPTPAPGERASTVRRRLDPTQVWHLRVPAKETTMARLRQKGPGATRLVRDDDLAPMPIMPWGTVHNLTPTEASAARNITPISADCGVVSIVAIGGAAHFKQGNSNVVATVNDPYLPEGEWHELPVFEGSQWSHVSIISAIGAGAISAQIVERQ